MAHILKNPTKNNKGVILFSHKEIAFFSNGVKTIRYDFVNKITSKLFPFDVYKSQYQKDLIKLHEKYFFGQHFGWYHEDYPTMPMIDFYLATDSTVSFQDEASIFRIPLSSSSFINQSFSEKQYTKVWDIVCVSHNGNNKRLQSFFKSVRKLFDSGKKYKILLINNASVNETKKRHYTEIEEDYNSMFSHEERQYFSLLRLNTSLSFLGLPTQCIADFYNLSKVFALFSEKEGEPRAVSEALLCNLPVVMNKHIKAGGVGLDNLNPKNSVLFDNYDDAHLALIEAVENYESFSIDVESLKRQLREDYTRDTLIEYLTKLYKNNGQEFDKKLDNAIFLANAVNGHLTDVPWARGRMLSSDIMTRKQFELFFDIAQSKH